MEINDIMAIAQAGAIPMLTFAVIALWRRLNAVTDSFTAYLKDSASKGDVAAQRALNGRDRN